MDSIEFTFAGIDFKVDLYRTPDGEAIDCLVGVYAYSKQTGHYEWISCDLNAFEDDMEDQINEALEEMYKNEQLKHEDDVFDRMKEAQYFD